MDPTLQILLMSGTSGLVHYGTGKLIRLAQHVSRNVHVSGEITATITIKYKTPSVQVVDPVTEDSSQDTELGEEDGGVNVMAA